MVMQAGPSLLYVAPVVPALTGNGLAMRAGMVLEALCASFQVWVLVVPLYPSAADQIPEPLSRLCQACIVASEADAAEAYKSVEFDVVHVFRMAAVPFARPYLQPPGRRPKRHLDLDDIESGVQARIAELMRANGDLQHAAEEQARSKRTRMLEASLLPFFDRVYVCSKEDRSELSERCRSEICILPNAVREPARIVGPSEAAEFRFLFLATFGYYPNHDAAVFFCTQVLPLMRRAINGAFGVDLVGTGVSSELAQLAADCGVRVTGPVPDVAPWYEQASAVIVPMRAGGGTRIKILEAFSYLRPVVSTGAGVQGIEAGDGEHVLVADTPESFAAQCRRLTAEPALRASLSEQARALWQKCYTPEAVRASLARGAHA